MRGTFWPIPNYRLVMSEGRRPKPPATPGGLRPIEKTIPSVFDICTTAGPYGGRLFLRSTHGSIDLEIPLGNDQAILQAVAFGYK